MSTTAMAAPLFFDERIPRWMITAVSGIVFACGLSWQNPVLLGGGALGLCVACVTALPRSPIATRKWSGLIPGIPSTEPGESAVEASTPRAVHPPRVAALPNALDPTGGTLVESMLATGRYALLLRPETCRHLSPTQWMRAIRVLDERMSLVPAGRVLIGHAAEQATLGHGAYEAPTPRAGRGLMPVEACYLDRCTVTNADFQHFVDEGGYEELDFWPEEALPAMFDFIDQSGQPGPRYWADGRYPEGQTNLPVVGISWYEAAAYARWVGKQLPNDAEWTKAGAWPIESAPGRLTQRRYPWGDSFDSRRASIWGAGDNGPLPVDAHPDGVSVGGVYQLIGNVWEWSASNLADSMPTNVTVPAALRSIRGGAFDTYFENQATCHFQSGEHPLARRPNIGFRLAVPMTNLASLESAHAFGSGIGRETQVAAEVEVIPAATATA
ncbi:MAG: SUMF1/EgtB/PvdO family nonheme iron enzyme [Pirellulales bacterium]